MDNIMIVVGACLILLLITGIVIVANKLSKVKKEKSDLEAKTALEIQELQNQIEEQKNSWANEKQLLLEKHLTEMDSLREECKHVVRHTKEEIENREDVLSKMSERELLVKTMLALDGYADKLARIEMSTAGVMVDVQTSLAINDFTEQIGFMKETITKQLTEVSNDYSKQLSEYSTDYSKRLSDISDDHTVQLSKVSSGIIGQLDSLGANVKSLIEKMEESITKSHNSVLEKIDIRLNKADVVAKMEDMLVAVKGVQNYLKTGIEIPDYSEQLQRLAGEIQKIISTVQSVDSTVDDIDRSVNNVSDKLGYNDWRAVDQRFDELESLVRDCIDAAEKARDAAESVSQ